LESNFVPRKKIPRDRLVTVSVIPQKKEFIPIPKREMEWN